MKASAYQCAVGLANACGLDWARFALGLTVTECTCDDSDDPPPDPSGFPRFRRSAHCRRHNPVPLPVPSRIEELHAPYLEDCERRGVKPGPLPAMKYTSSNGHTDWGFFDGHPYIRVAGLSAEAWKHAWDIRGCGSSDDIRLMAALVMSASNAAKSISSAPTTEEVIS